MTSKKYFFRASAEDFRKIPGSPIAYWVSEKIRDLFISGYSIEDITISDGQNITADNDTYLRNFWEVSQTKIGIDKKWLFYAKGGEFRKWWGNLDHIVDWSPSARDFYHSNGSARIIPEYLWYKIGVTWTLLSSGKTGFRYLPAYATFDKTGSSIFLKDDIDVEFVVALLCSTVSTYLLSTFSSTIAYQVKEIRKIPVVKNYKQIGIVDGSKMLISISRIDYNNNEISWDFQSQSLLATNKQNKTLKNIYSAIRQNWQSATLETQALETENNRIFIEAYGLQDELTPEVPLKEITLTCNPYYRYGIEECEVGSAKWEAMEKRLLEDTMKEFISYAVGCMFGRYSLDKPGLILANAGETVEDYLKQIPNPTFMPDSDNVIPLMSMDWFTDDLAERFNEFLKITFGTENFDTNLQFIEKALGKNGKPLTIRDYFLKDFYNDHVRRYKKRPIYWLFSSPKDSFNALIYMHRYRPDTVSSILNGYLREFRTKLSATKNHLEAVSISGAASAGEKTKALKDIENIRKIIEEIDVYERDILYPLATKQIEIDLDDGVKVNYQKFGTAVKKIVGLDSKEED